MGKDWSWKSSISSTILHNLQWALLSRIPTKKLRKWRGMGLTERKGIYLRFLREDQAAIAAFFSACFFVLAGSPMNLLPPTSTMHLKSGRCFGPDLIVVYTGRETPALCAVSCSKFLQTPVSSCKNMEIKKQDRMSELRVSKKWRW